jgi:four helix bundle protein
MPGFESLEIWQLAHALAVDIYRATASFPADERFGLTSQLRRAAASVGGNIAEGYGRHNTQDTIRFLYIARGSLMETRSFLYLARDLGFLPYEQAASLVRDTARLSVKITNCVESLGRARYVRDGAAGYDAAPDEDHLTTT